MNVPNLPTDNLYKFIALSGLLISISCIVTPSIISKQILDELIAIEAEADELALEVEFLKEKRDRLDKKATALEEGLDRYEISDDTTKHKIDLSGFYE
ncbi:hypothetical protein OB13_10540, partial [Pontibacter sp. HJ8]